MMIIEKKYKKEKEMTILSVMLPAILPVDRDIIMGSDHSPQVIIVPVKTLPLIVHQIVLDFQGSFLDPNCVDSEDPGLVYPLVSRIVVARDSLQDIYFDTIYPYTPRNGSEWIVKTLEIDFRDLLLTVSHDTLRIYLFPSPCGRNIVRVNNVRLLSYDEDSNHGQIPVILMTPPPASTVVATMLENNPPTPLLSWNLLGLIGLLILLLLITIVMRLGRHRHHYHYFKKQKKTRTGA